MDGKGGSAISSKPACQRSRDNVFGVTICLLSRAQSWFHWHVPCSSCPWNMNMRHRVFFPVRRTGNVTGFCPRSWIFYFFCPIQHRFRLLSGEWFVTEVGSLVYEFLECLLIRRHPPVESTARGPADSCRNIGPNASGEEDGVVREWHICSRRTPKANSFSAAVTNKLPAGRTIRFSSRWRGIKTKRIVKIVRIVTDIGIQVKASVHPDRILRNESLQSRAVIATPIEIQAGAVIFSACILVQVCARASRTRALSECLVRILRLNRTGSIRQRHCAAQDISKKVADACRVGPSKDLVKTSVQEVGSGGRPREFLNEVCAIVEIRPRRAADGLRNALPDRIVLEARCHSSTDGTQPISRVPSVGLAPIIRKISVRIVRERRAAPLGELIIGVMGPRREWRRHVRPGVAAADAGASAGIVVGVIQITQRGGAELVADAGRLGRGIVVVDGGDAVRERQRCPAAPGVVAERHCRASLRDLYRSIRVIVAVGDGWLTGDGHRGLTTTIVITIRNGSAGTALGCQPV